MRVRALRAPSAPLWQVGGGRVLARRCVSTPTFAFMHMAVADPFCAAYWYNTVTVCFRGNMRTCAGHCTAGTKAEGSSSTTATHMAMPVYSSGHDGHGMRPAARVRPTPGLAHEGAARPVRFTCGPQHTAHWNQGLGNGPASISRMQYAAYMPAAAQAVQSVMPDQSNAPQGRGTACLASWGPSATACCMGHCMGCLFMYRGKTT